MAGVDLTGMEPGGDVGVGPDAARPQPSDAPGDRSGGWVKVGAGADGGRVFPYVDDVPAPGGGGWKQT